MMELSDTEPALSENEVAETSEANASEVVKEGYLVKQGGGHKSWKKRWFVLTLTSLKYYKHADNVGKKSLGTIQLRNETVSVEKVSEPGQKGYYFRIVTPERIYLVSGQSDSDVDGWVASIQKVLPGKDRSAVFTGYLTKQGGSHKSWKKRWFSLRSNNLLLYYRDEKDNVSQGAIDLEIVTELRSASKRIQKEFAFELITKSRVYVMVAPTKSEYDEWMKHLQTICGPIEEQDDEEDEDDKAPSMEALREFIRIQKKTKEGYLTKRGGKIKTWKYRWFVLRESTLAYYKSENDESPLGLISLSDCKGFELASKKKIAKANAFYIETKERQFYLYADTEEIMWDWIKVLGEAVKNVDTSDQEFIALKQASELAAKKKALQARVIRNQTLTKFAKISSALQKGTRRYSRKILSDRSSKHKSWAKNYFDQDMALSREIEVLKKEKDRLVEQLNDLGIDDNREVLTLQLNSLQAEIDKLNHQLTGKQGIDELAMQMEQVELRGMSDASTSKRNSVVLARAVVDYSPNANDSEHLTFTVGNIITVTKKSIDGQWFGKLVGKEQEGFFPSRYVEELDQDKSSCLVTEREGDMSDQLDDAAKSLFIMYDSDNDGYLTKLDFFEFLYEFGKTYLSDQQVEKCWSVMDASKTGMVNPLQFRDGVKALDSHDFFAEWHGS
eukprot:Lithocolla_globosa_v1_NODE_1787_length_2341_cov_4.365267.p1 type:complete len:671 gc:universal NODE_1787_length_2341_cov_4.365267:2196-184(-)